MTEEKELMERQSVEKLMDRWMNDPAFKDKMTSDPETTLAECGIMADEKLLEAVKTLDSTASAEELQERVVKSGGYN